MQLISLVYIYIRYPPFIPFLQYGSPAEKDNLEVADEILDVNERKLEDLTRTEVIRHIHECIQSCMIKLRVKRRSDSRLGNYQNISLRCRDDRFLKDTSVEEETG